MTTEQLVSLIRAAIADELEIPVSSLSDEGSLRTDYGLDSVAAVNIVFALETRLGLEIDIKQFAVIDSIRELSKILATRSGT